MDRRAARLAALVAGSAILLLAGCGDTRYIRQESAGGGVTRSERVWVDTSRETPPTATFAGAPDRALRVLIWTPLGSDPLPLLVMAHGFGGLPEEFDAFARATAMAGFIVAAPAFPLTNADAPGGHEAGVGDFVNQAGDVSFVITRLLEASATGGDPLFQRILSADIAVLGHSLGSVGVLAMSRKSCCRDDRVGAVILAGSPWNLVAAYGPDPISASGPPTLILHGTADDTVPFANARLLYDQLEAPRFLVGIEGAGHSEALEDQTEPPIEARQVAQDAAIGFLDGVFRDDGAGFSATLDRLAAAGNAVRSDPSSQGLSRARS